jgi:hypothetical protein
MTACEHRNGPVRLTAITRSHSGRVIASMRVGNNNPALLTRMVGGCEKLLVANATSRFTSSCLVTSAAHAAAHRTPIISLSRSA